MKIIEPQNALPDQRASNPESAVALLRKSRWPVVIATALLAWSAPSSPASLLLYEGFDYGGTSVSLDGLGTTGGGWTGAWDVGSFTYSGSPSFSESYQPTGLTFSSLPVSGGNAFLSTAWNGGLNVGRAHSASATGTLFGSFLFQRTANTSSSIELFSLWEGNDINGADNFAQFAIEPDRYQSTLGGVIGDQNYGTTTGTAISTGNTYLVLFKVTNLGPTSATHDTTMWILQADQYDNFLPGGLDEAELNGAATGTAADQVLQRATRTSTNTAQFASGNLLMMQNFYLNAQARFDEIRISDSSLNEVVTVPEPGAGLLLVGAALAFATRRRRAG